MIRGTVFSAVTAQRDPLPGQATFNHDMMDDMADIDQPASPAEERKAAEFALAYKPVHGGYPDYQAYGVK